MQHFEATAVKDGKFWEISIPQLNMVTATKRLNEVQEYAASLAAATLDIDLEDVNVEVTFQLPLEAQQRWKEARELTAKAQELTRNASAQSKEVIRDLKAKGYTLREIEKVLGISFQRVSQLLRP